MFPILSSAELRRARSFGELRHYDSGATVVRTGEAGRGITVILKGSVAVMRRDYAGKLTPVVTHGAGGFMGCGSSAISLGARVNKSSSLMGGISTIV